MRVFIAGQKAFGAAVLELCLRLGVEIVGVTSPVASSNGQRPDRLKAAAEHREVPWLPPGTLCESTLPAYVDLIISAHSHDFIGRKTRLRTSLGAIGYHPSLLPRHRGRDAIKWTVKMGDAVSGGTIYWLSDNVDAGDIAAQDWCWVYPGTTARDLWRDQLFPMGLRLFERAVLNIMGGIIVAVPQDEQAATWEPSWERQPIRRPDLLLLPSNAAAERPRHTILKDQRALHSGRISDTSETVFQRR